MYVAILAVGFLNNSQFQLVKEVVEIVAQLLHLLRLVVPLTDLLRVLLHLGGKVVVDSLILLNGRLRGALQALFHNREAVEHLRRDVQCQHSHQNNVHQIDHLLTGRNGSLLNCHSLLLTSDF